MKKRYLVLSWFIPFVIGTGLVSGAGSGGALRINGDTPWIVMKADYANMPIQKVIRDAERDWYKVFGYPPVIFRDSVPLHWNGPVVVFGSAENTKELIDSVVPEGKEQYHLFLGTLAQKNPALIAAGSDTRGTVFAIYTFCEEVLGIDPMYIFTDSKPEKRSGITLDVDFEIVSKKPTFEYRGWFINDEELHDGMHRDPLGGNVISMEWMDKILETLLRCKGNMIIPESSPYSDATVYDLCQRRDVVITHHHIAPTGLNMMDWPKGVPFSFVTHKEILIDAWKKSVKAQQDKKVAWIIGFRGESDGAFWNSDPAAPQGDAERAAIIAEAMQTQTEIIRAVDPDATIVAALWNEQSRFYNAGLLKIPDGVCKMFSDDGRGFMRDDSGTHVEAGDGLYYHVMMQMNTQNRTTEAVPPARFYSELKRYVEKGATKYAIINVSGIRPAAMSVEAITDFLWDAEPALSKAPEAAMADYLNAWYAKEFGPELASRLTDLRLKYYDIPYMREKMPIQGRWRGARAEHLIQHLTQGMLKKYGNAVTKGDDLQAMNDFGNQFQQAQEPLAETAEFFPSLWAETKALEKEIPSARKDYYQSHFTYQVAVHMYSCRALTIVKEAFKAYLNDRDAQAFAKHIALAIDEIEKIIEEAHKAEYGIWDTMYMHVRLMDFWRTRLLLKSTIAKIENKPYTDSYRGYMKGSFWGSAQEYMDHAEGVFPYFYKHSGRGLDVLEEKSAANTEFAPEPTIFNVKTFGAVGDGVDMDTKALQAAIDACSENEGGVVWVPAGNYHIGTIRMKSNVTLSLDYEAYLLGSQNISDYATDLRVTREGEKRCLIYAEDATNLVIEGLGVIDGCGTPEAFPRKQGSPRPHLMHMVNCDQITFSGVTYKRPASWGLHLIDCRDIHFNAVTIRFRNNGYNNDGLDLDGCENVLIENCDIDSGDDAICLKSSLNLCRNIVVRGCKVASNTAPLKLGTSSRGGFVDVSVTNCFFYNSPMGAIKLELVDGGRLENVNISRIVMEDVGNPIFIRLGNRGRSYKERTGQKYNADVESEGVPVGTLKNIRISNVVAEVTGEDKSRSGPIMISGIPGHYVEDVVLENIKISYPGSGTTEDAERVVPEDEARYPEQFFFGILPSWGAYIRHARNIEFKNVEMQTRAPDKRKKIVLEDVEGFVER